MDARAVCAHERAVLDRVDFGGQRIADALATVRVARDGAAE